MPLTSNKRIAILGATGHIAKGLITQFASSGQHELFLFARSPLEVKRFLQDMGASHSTSVAGFDAFAKGSYDVIINGVGIGQPNRLKDELGSIFSITETYDNLVIDYLTSNPDATYINFSSGAVYGTDFSRPLNEQTQSKWNINSIAEADLYGIAKLQSEAKHRAMRSYKIIDIRVFGYFSRFINLASGYLLTEIINCIRNKTNFITDQEDIVRDFIHPEDLTSLILQCLSKDVANDVFDAYTRKPVTKFELLDFFTSRYGLQVTKKSDRVTSSVTGSKKHYYATSKKAETIGYRPHYTSLDTVMIETEKILGCGK